MEDNNHQNSGFGTSRIIELVVWAVFGFILRFNIHALLAYREYSLIEAAKSPLPTINFCRLNKIELYDHDYANYWFYFIFAILLIVFSVIPMIRGKKTLWQKIYK